MVFVSSSYVKAYEDDFPDVIDIRKKILGESEKDILLPYSLFELEWTKKVDTAKPTLMTARGVFEYIDEKDVIKFLSDVKRPLRITHITLSF